MLQRRQMGFAASAFVAATSCGVGIGTLAASLSTSLPSSSLSTTASSSKTAAPVRFVDPIDDAPVHVVARADWDPDPVPLQALRRRARPVSSSSFIVVHHSDFDEQPGPTAILDSHRRQAGFSDIGYHFVVAGDGTVYEARPLDRVGAHAGISREQRHDPRKDPDEDAIGIVLDGNFEHAAPSPTQVASAITLVRDLRRRLHIPMSHVIGHRDVKAKIVEGAGLTFAGTETVCPGEALYSIVPAIRVLSTPSSTSDVTSR